jgi:hypothetical protein
MLPSCGSPGETSSGDGGSESDAPADVRIPDGQVVVPKTLACAGDKSTCLSGTLAVKDFTAKPTATRVTLYHVFPHGNVAVVASTPVALDGTFAFSRLDSWAHYYLQGEARFDKGTNAYSMITNVGSFTVPATQAPIPIVIRPVFLEVLQNAPSGGATTVTWASAHLFDPSSGTELTAGTVSLTANGTSYPMPYVAGAGGMKSFNVSLPAGIPGGTSFTITTSYPELEASPVTWNLVGEPATFGGAIVSPTGPVPANKALTVTWQAQPSAAYSQTELFLQQGTDFVLSYTSSTVNAPDVTTETIPAANLTTSGTYQLDEAYANATCPASADGCVYDLATTGVTLTVQ